jgi:predicted O-methyltransferase YrrM
MCASEIEKLLASIEGWLTVNEGQLLYNLAKNCKGNGVIVEIGSWKGRSTVCLAKGSKEGKKLKVYAIDPHANTPSHKDLGEASTLVTFKRNISSAGVDEIVVPLVKTSAEARKTWGATPRICQGHPSSKAVQLLFIDGSHEYQMVKLDFELWFPEVVNGGIVAFHDTTDHAGPYRVVKEFVCKSRNLRKRALKPKNLFKKSR